MVTGTSGSFPWRHRLRSVGFAFRASGKAIRYLGLVLPAAACLCATARASDAFLQDRRTDANVITAIDVSDSIGRHAEWVQQTGLVRALLHPGFLGAATAGPHGRIGFAAFTWSSDGKFDLLVPWTIIGSAEEAARVSAALASVEIIDRSDYGGGDHEDARGEDDVVSPERLTDISVAIDYASLRLRSAPYATSRSVMNILANGIDNVQDETDDGVGRSRDRALDRGFTINGLALGSDAEVVQYFRSNVIGGRGAFVMELSDPNEAGEIMMEKFRRDLIASVTAAKPPPHPRH